MPDLLVFGSGEVVVSLQIILAPFYNFKLTINMEI